MINQTITDRLADYAHRQFPETPKSIIYMAIYTAISEMLCFNRTRIRIRGDNFVIPNLYSIMFYSSGGGKDIMVTKIKECIPFFENKQNICKEISSSRRKDIRGKAEQLIKKGQLTKAKLQAYINERPVRELETETDNATPEGLESMRLAFQNEQIGYLHFANSELGKYISTNSSAGGILNYLNNVYEGSAKAKFTKSEMTLSPSKGIPQTMFAFSSLIGLVDDDKATATLKSFLDTGLARRSFLCFPSDFEKGESVDISEYWQEEWDFLEQEKKELRGIFTKVEEDISTYSHKGNEVWYKTPHTFDLSKDGGKALFKYKDKCFKSCTNQDETLDAEKKNRWWKCLKLSAIITFLDAKKFIDEDSVNKSIKLTEQYSKYMERFFHIIEDDKAMAMYLFIKKKGKTNLTQLRTAKQESGKSILGKRRDDTKFLLTIVEQVKSLCEEEKNEKLIEIKKGNSISYSIEGEQLEDSGEICRILIGESKLESCLNFKEKQIKFSELKNIICGSKKYMPAILKGTRKQENWIGGDNLLIFDIDNKDCKELKIAEARERFKEYNFIIASTKKHKTEKGGGVDRFRIIFKIEPLHIKIAEYKQVKKSILKHFGIGETGDDVADLTPSTHWAPSPQNCEYFLNKTGKNLNWKFFLEEEKKTKKSYSKKTYTEPQNTRPNQTFELKNGEVVDWDYFTQKTNSTPVRCTEPNHDDNDPSAFVSTHQDSGNLRFNCSICSIQYFNK